MTKPLNKFIIITISIFLVSCITPKINIREANKKIPSLYYLASSDSINVSKINWKFFFEDEYLNQLIDSALINNQELNIFLQDIEISKNEVREKKGEYMPKVGLDADLSNSKISENTRDGSLDKILDKNNLNAPNGELGLGANLAWEVDIWKRLRNAKNAAEMRLMATKEGKNLLVTRLIAEIANTYYELLALDNTIKILNENILIQEEAYNKMKVLKDYAKANQLAVNRFEAQLLNTKNQKFNINQQIIETENRLKFLTGKIAAKVNRDSDKMLVMNINSIQTGVPIQLLQNRPDIRQAEFVIKSSQLDLKVAKANLYPKLDISAGLGFRAFDPSLLIKPQSLIYNAAGGLMAPLINRNAVIARMNVANAVQIQASLNYEQILLQSYTEVLNQMAKIDNTNKSYEMKKNEVKILNESVDVANSLFQYAKADYIEVLLTQKEHLNAEMELIETKLNLIGSKVDLYRALGGGWQ